MAERAVDRSGGRPWDDPARLQRLVVLVSPMVVFAFLAWQRRWMQEDGFINLRIVDQVMAGHGPVFNAGQRVEAFTSPLWLGILVVLRTLLGWAVPLEWLAVVAGIALAVVGVAGLVAGAAALQDARRQGRFVSPDLLVPAGVLVPLAVPAVWDFASSGLETGLAMGWVGGSFWALARHARLGNRRRTPLALSGWTAALFGLGPLIRPELGLHSLAFAIAAVLLSPRDRRFLLTRAAGFLALPVAYQLFRMGFFASLLPNTALAKDAGGSLWSRGTRYFGNFAGAYALVVPVLALGGLVVLCRPQRANRAWVVVAGALVGPALLQVLYVVRVGGDYMHGRFLVVPLLALVAPVAVVPLDVRTNRWQLQVPVVGALALWAAVSAIHLRPPPQDGIAIDDQRTLVVAFTRHSYPVRAADQPSFFVAAGRTIHHVGRGDVFVVRPNLTGDETQIVPRAKGDGPAAKNDAIGVTGYLAGPKVALIDPAGLAEPVGARLPATSSARAGSSHSLPPDWLAARARLRADQLTPGARQAKHALACGALGRLVRDTEGPLTPSRFLGDLLDAPANTTLKIPLEPATAERRFCGS